MISVFEIFIAAGSGAVISFMGVVLLALAHFMIQRRLYDVTVYTYEIWAMYPAPIIGGTTGWLLAGKVVAGGAVVVIAIMALGALIGGMVLPTLKIIWALKARLRQTAREHASSLDLIGSCLAGVILGSINGGFLVVAFTLLGTIRWG